MIAIGISALLPKHSTTPANESRAFVVEPQASHVATRPLGTAAKPASGSGLDPWTRPSAKVAARNARRARFAVVKTLGASEQIVNRLTNADIRVVIQELKQQAQRGDASAGNILYFMARINCTFARNNVERKDLGAQALPDAQALAQPDAEWLKMAFSERADADQPRLRGNRWHCSRSPQPACLTRRVYSLFVNSEDVLVLRPTLLQQWRMHEKRRNAAVSMP
jgi:hypothetical protein